MKRNLIPVIMMLVSGAVSCLFTMARGESLLFRMSALLGSMLLFYVLGRALCGVLDHFDRENDARLAAETAAAEEEADEDEADNVTAE